MTPCDQAVPAAFYDRDQAVPAAFYDRDPARAAADIVARGLLLVRQSPEGLTAGRIVEAEAYLAENDPACHAAGGYKPRCRAMFGPPGTAYCYRIHQVCCVNAVTEAAGRPSAVLIRAVVPVVGLEIMHRRRPVLRETQLTSGPGKLCQAFAIDLGFDGFDLTLTSAGLWLADPYHPSRRPVCTSPRVGVTSAQSLALRFFDPDSAFVSGAR